MPILATAAVVSQIAGQGASIGLGIFGAQNALKVEDTKLVEAFNFGIPEFDWPGLFNVKPFKQNYTPREAARLISAGDAATQAVMTKYQRSLSRENWSHTVGWPNVRAELTQQAAKARVPSLLGGGKALAASLFGSGGGEESSGLFGLTPIVGVVVIGAGLLLSILLLRK